MGLFIKLTSDICHENGRVVHFSLVQFAQFSSVQDDSYAFRKAHMYSTLSLGSFLNVAFKTVPVFL